MRSLLLPTLAASLALAAGAAHAQSGYGTFAPNKSSPPKVGGNGFQPLPGSEPYKPHTAPAAPKPLGNIDGGEGFKPFKPGSTYSDRGGLDPYKKAAKPHSIYDH